MLRGRNNIPEHKRKYKWSGGQKAIHGYAENGNKSVTICYCKGVAKEKKDEEAILPQQLSSLHQLMWEKQLQDTIAKYYEVKLKSSRSQNV